MPQDARQPCVFPMGNLGILPSLLFPAEDEPLLPEVPKCDANILDTTVVIPGSWLSNTFRNILTNRAFVSQFHNFLQGLQLHTDYVQNSHFSMWKGNTTGGCMRPTSVFRTEKGMSRLPQEKDELLYVYNNSIQNLYNNPSR